MKPPSGTFLVRVSPALHRRLRDLAVKRGESLNRLCAQALEQAVSATPDSVRGPDEPWRGWDALAARCREEFGDALQGVVLFGSVARGEAFPGSDADLLLVLRRGEAIRRDLYARWEATLAPLAERSVARDVNPHFSHIPASPEEAGGLWLEVAIDGCVLWDREGRLSAALRALRAHLAAGGAVRRVRHGHPYWVRSRPAAEERDRR